MKIAMHMQQVNFIYGRIWQVLSTACMVWVFIGVHELWGAASRGRVIDQDGRPLVSVARLARHHGLRPAGERNERWEWRRGEDHLVLELNSRRMWWNGVLCWLHEPVVEHRSNWYVDQVDARTVLAPLFSPAEFLTGIGYRRIMLDPGHGGSDPGARGATGVLEKDVVLAVAQYAAKLLEAAGYEVRLTRPDDRSVSLPERVRLASEWPADLFVSIHLNSAANTAARGTEVFVLSAGDRRSTSDRGDGPFPAARPANQFDGANQLLAHALQRRITNSMALEDRGIRRARFQVLREAVSPAILIEGGFLSNPEEARKLASTDYQQRMAEAIVLGIQDYLSLVLLEQVKTIR